MCIERCMHGSEGGGRKSTSNGNSSAPYPTRQMVIKKKENETPKERCKRQIRNRLVYNDWGLYSFVQMLTYKCLHVGKELYIISERDTTKTCHVCKHKKDMPLYLRTYRCENCGLVMDRDDNSAVNIYERFLARLGPHTL